LTRADGGDRTKRSSVTRLAVLPGKAGARTKPEPLRCEATECVGKTLDSVQWRPGGAEVLFTVTDRDAGEAQSIFRWNIATGEVRAIVSAQGLINGGRIPSSTCGVSATALACVAAEAAGPPRLEAVDIATGQRRVLFEPNDALAGDMQAAVSTR